MWGHSGGHPNPGRCKAELLHSRKLMKSWRKDQSRVLQDKERLLQADRVGVPKSPEELKKKNQNLDSHGLQIAAKLLTLSCKNCSMDHAMDYVKNCADRPLGASVVAGVEEHDDGDEGNDPENGSDEYELVEVGADEVGLPIYKQKDLGTELSSVDRVIHMKDTIELSKDVDKELLHMDEDDQAPPQKK